MYYPFSGRRKRIGARVLPEATFCETCNQVFTPIRRHETDLNRYRQSLQRDGLIRY